MQLKVDDNLTVNNLGTHTTCTFETCISEIFSARHFYVILQKCDNSFALQRGRDHGLPDYATARRNLGLKTLESFEEINPFLFANQTHTTSPPETRNETGAEVKKSL